MAFIHIAIGLFLGLAFAVHPLTGPPARTMERTDDRRAAAGCFLMVALIFGLVWFTNCAWPT